MRDQTATTMNRAAAGAGRAPRSLWRDKAGAVAVWLALSMVMFLPAAAIAVELTRLQVLQTELQQAADAAALAGANQLNFTSAGLTAANTAARTAVTNQQRMATSGGVNIAVGRVQFLRALPPAPNKNYDFYATTSAADARYVRVITEQRQMRSAIMVVWNAMYGQNATAEYEIAAEAVAGRTTVACKPVPLMMCNPAESLTSPFMQLLGAVGPGPGEASPTGGFQKFGDFLKRNPNFTRRLMRIKMIGPGGSYGPGLFGLVQPMFNEGRGADVIRNELAMNVPQTCVDLGGVQLLETRGGQANGPTQDGLNVRFGIYPNGSNGAQLRALGSPAANVIKGVPTNNGCITGNLPNNPNLNQHNKLERDNCYYGATDPQCAAMAGGDGRIGNGRWDLIRYLRINHASGPGTAPATTGTGASRQVGATVWAQLQAQEKAIFDERGITAAANQPTPVATRPAWGDLAAQSNSTAIQQSVSRYAVYRWELAQGRVPRGGNWPAGTGQLGNESGITSGTGTCPAALASDSAAGPNQGARRLLYIAVINCVQNASSMKPNTNVPFVEFLEAFMTEPLDQGNDATLFVEPIRGVGARNDPNSQVVLRDVVQLY